MQDAWSLNEDKTDFDADDGEDNDDDDGDEEFLVVFPVPCSLPSPPSTIGLLIRILGGGAHWGGGGGGDEDGGDDADACAYDDVDGQKTLMVRMVPMGIYNRFHCSHRIKDISDRFLREGVKKRGYFTARLTVRGGRSAPLALTISKREHFDPFFQWNMTI